MFEFEKQIMKNEGRYPLVGYPYKVIPLTKTAELAFAKFRSAPHRVIPNSLMDKFIKDNLNLEQEPYIGTVKLHADTNVNQAEVLARKLVVRRMATCEVPHIEYLDDFGMSKRHVLYPLIYDKDFTIELGEKIIYDEQPKKLTFADIKAL